MAIFAGETLEVGAKRPGQLDLDFPIFARRITRLGDSIGRAVNRQKPLTESVPASTPDRNVRASMSPGYRAHVSA
jgi:hypothetical protein